MISFRVVTKVVITKCESERKNLFTKAKANANTKAKDLVSF